MVGGLSAQCPTETVTHLSGCRTGTADAPNVQSVWRAVIPKRSSQSAVIARTSPFSSPRKVPKWVNRVTRSMSQPMHALIVSPGEVRSDHDRTVAFFDHADPCSEPRLRPAVNQQSSPAYGGLPSKICKILGQIDRETSGRGQQQVWCMQFGQRP